ncbi:Transcriptional activator GLI3 [Dissostichus eleginoides]|uniref:Transcriptional activator GLI3 n=1 Tax=Dissostichus eleginoides TaxID=100907 RepID=A0AAD9BWT3_DISEL|nr:Transcriptional activator GLI3 [Dissostichus eleginoides]
MELVAAFAVGFSSLTLRSRSLRVKSEHTKNKVELANENMLSCVFTVPAVARLPLSHSWEKRLNLKEQTPPKRDSASHCSERERSRPTAGTVNTEAANEEEGVTIPPRAEQEGV